MDKILDKFGIYDLFVNFITGMMIFGFFGYLQVNLFKISWFNIVKVDQMETWLFLLASYFTGVIFHEISNFIETVLYRVTYNIKKRKFRCPILLLVIPSIDRILITTEEINQYKKSTRFILRKKLKRDLDDAEIKKLKTEIGKDLDQSALQYNELLYNLCRSRAIKNNNGRLVNDQSHASMARSLVLYSFIILITSLLVLRYKFGEINIVQTVLVAILSTISLLLFIQRNKRFSEMRYVSIFRACIYE